MNNLAHKKILVTGASGFIGQHLVDALCALGADVYGTSRTPRESNVKNFTWLQGSFDDLSETKKILQELKPDIIFHLAGVVTASSDVNYVLPTYHSLLTSTINLLAVATDIGCERIVLAGSCTEPDDNDLTPSSPYAAAKWAMSGYARMFHKLYSSPIVLVRPFMGYGPGQAESKVLSYVISSLLHNESPKLSSCSWVTDWVYIQDMVDGILAAAAIPGIEGEMLDLGSGIRISIKEIIEKIAKSIVTTGKPLFGALPDRQHDHTRIADTEHTFSKIGWRATTPMDTGLKNTIEYYKKVF